MGSSSSDRSLDPELLGGPLCDGTKLAKTRCRIIIGYGRVVGGGCRQWHVVGVKFTSVSSSVWCWPGLIRISSDACSLKACCGAECSQQSSTSLNRNLCKGILASQVLRASTARIAPRCQDTLSFGGLSRDGDRSQRLGYAYDV
ncbi:hypothetical protein MRB53_037154 [Persea americana]|nr:hypothetical protein MRB53_037154 [Persea americana]